MFFIVFAFILFVGSLIVHLSFCRRTSQPGLHTKAYLSISGIALMIYAIGAFMVEQGGMLDEQSLWGLPLRFTAAVLFILLVPAYLCFYVLTQLMSPSKKILLTIARRGQLSHAEILACVKEEEFISTRLSDLCASGCVVQVNGKYSLSASGRQLAATLNLMQAVLGRGMGG